MNEAWHKMVYGADKNDAHLYKTRSGALTALYSKRYTRDKNGKYILGDLPEHLVIEEVEVKIQ